MTKTSTLTAALALASLLGGPARANGDAAFQQSLAAGRELIIKTGEGASGIGSRPGELSESSPWWLIKRQANPIFPQIPFHNWLISVDGLCVDGPNLRPLDPYKEQCVEWAHRGDNDYCVRTEKVYFSTPIRHKKEACVEWKQRGDDYVCAKTRIEEHVRALSYLVEVRGSLPASGERDAPVLFTKRFDIPSCR